MGYWTNPYHPPWAVDDTIVQPAYETHYGAMMPDIAYDPRTDQPGFNSRGDLYLVYTWYNPDDTDLLEGPRVYIKFGIRNNLLHDWLYSDFVWLDPPSNPPTPIHYLTSQGEGVPHDRICHGFHPKIDIGYISFVPGHPERWTVAVAFTADGGNFEPHIVTWNAGWPIYDARLELPIRLSPYIILNSVEYPGFMPSVDIGPNGANHCAVTWTQARSENWNDVTVGYIDNHGGAFYLDLEPDFTQYYLAGIMEAFAFPSVAVWDDENNYRTSISYLNSLNPVTNRWDSRAVTYDTIFDIGPPISVTTELQGTETNISIATHGLYDSGSQYSNWYGISSSMSVHNGRYWVLYSAMPDPNTEDSNLNLNKVYGSFGWTDY
ncbi:MAG: hypothetical protein NTY09_13475 [bacterium]|nr:hypothetical protein [bacterium]